ncbi:sialidase family protein [Methylocystis sp. SB2]|uniref:sialidase family protein n=1 Tax=Methylocystis sp. (strain SB2) TaxID=743836 RepID=UPI000411C4E4|nr:sialidase family protein [Methylocystis sp. SB2]ULO22828.1 glycoside hydrolase [Methylocystis sp. SB2]
MKRLALALLAFAASGAVSAEQGAPSTDAPKDAATPTQSAPPAAMSHHPAAACAEAKVDCAATAVPAFAKDGRLWVAFSVGKSLYAAASSDNGATFSAPTAIATIGDGVIDAHGDARPKIVALKDGTLLATYTTRPDKQMIGTIFTARSTDGGKTFSTPQALLAEGGQRFDSILVNRKGRIYAGWLDKTHALKAKAEGKEFLGSGVAFAYSDDGGKTFKGKSILIDHACECCRMSGALDKDGTPVFTWRQVLDGNVRDHMVAKLSADAAQATATRVSDDDWAINSCPHHGPSIAIDAAGDWHVVWFTKGKKRQGLYYARSLDEGKSFSEPEKFGDDARAAGHPTLVAAKGRLYRVWKEFDGATTTIAMQMSRDNGKSWSAPRVVAQTLDASDHPELIAHNGAAYLSWLTHKEGYRLMPLPRDEKSAAAPQ